MKNLLRFEGYHLIRQKSVFVISVLMLLFLTTQTHTSPARMEYFQQIGYGAEDMVVGLLSDCFFLSFLAVIIPLVVCRDYEQNVLKNVYAKGYTPERVFTGKFIFTLVFAAVLCLITMALGYVQTMMVFGWSALNLGSILFAQFVAVLAYAAFDFIFCILFQKSGYAIAWLVLIPPIGGLLLDILDSYLPISFSFGSLWITQTMSYIHGGTITGREIAQSLLTSVAYVVVCYIGGRCLLKKKEQ